MNDNGYKVLGFVVWRGAKWYARRRLPSMQAIAGATLAGLSVLVALALFARRASA
jgi:hypothetical protein